MYLVLKLIVLCHCGWYDDMAYQVFVLLCTHVGWWWSDSVISFLLFRRFFCIFCSIRISLRTHAKLEMNSYQWQCLSWHLYKYKSEIIQRPLWDHSKINRDRPEITQRPFRDHSNQSKLRENYTGGSTHLPKRQTWLNIDNIFLRGSFSTRFNSI